MPTPTLVLWIYIVLLFLGGLVGFLKAGSKMSLIMSAAFAAILVLCNIHIIPFAHVDDVVMIFLFVFFAVRFAKSKKLVPNGVMAIITVAALCLKHLAWFDRNF